MAVTSRDRELENEIENEFEDFAKKVDAINDEASEKGAMLIRVELRTIQELFPNHTIEFKTGAYAPYIEVHPPIGGETRIHEFDIKKNDHSEMGEIADRPQMQQLKTCIDRMSRIAVHVEDRYRVDLGIVVLDDQLEEENDLPAPGM
jgi:hypothetical protein